MGRPAYLIAKYVPDVFRNEPKNIGVIVWSDGAVTSRFLGQTKEGKIDGRTVGEEIRPFLSPYKQWVEAWQKMLSKERVRHFGSFEMIERADPKFLDAIISSGEGNFVLESGGELIEEVQKGEIGEVANFLFNRLVSIPNEENESISAEEKREQLLKDARVSHDSRVQRNKRVPVILESGMESHHEFHLAIGNGEIECLGHVVPVTARTRAVKTVADAVSFRFSHLNSPIVKKGAQKYVFIFSPEDAFDENIEDALVQLKMVADVIDLNKNELQAVELIRKTVLSAKAHE